MPLRTPWQLMADWAGHILFLPPFWRMWRTDRPSSAYRPFEDYYYYWGSTSGMHGLSLSTSACNAREPEPESLQPREPQPVSDEAKRQVLISAERLLRVLSPCLYHLCLLNLLELHLWYICLC